jgi:hypothetical protein
VLRGWQERTVVVTEGQHSRNQKRRTAFPPETAAARDHSAGARGRSAELREVRADIRELLADNRERLADERERAADTRDEIADARDLALDDRGRRAHPSYETGLARVPTFRSRTMGAR